MFQVYSCFWSVGYWFCTERIWTVDWPVLLWILWFCLVSWHPPLLFLIITFLTTYLFGTWVNLFQDLLAIPLPNLLNLLNLFYLLFDHDSCPEVYECITASSVLPFSLQKRALLVTNLGRLVLSSELLQSFFKIKEIYLVGSWLWQKKLSSSQWFWIIIRLI